MPNGTDAFLWYNAGDWGPYGLAVPNAGNDRASQNSTIRNLVELIGRNLAAIMWHTDAALRVPPSINTITRIHKLCVRARDILASRSVAPGTQNMETAHAVPSWEEFLVFPTPYFKVRNPWMKDYCGLILLSLTDAMQHQENAKPLEISKDFSGLIGQYIQRVYRQMSVELLKVDLVAASAPSFTLTSEQLAAYDPSKWFTSTEMIDTVPAEFSRPTEDDLSVLTDGIPYSHLPVLGRFPGSVSATSVGATATAAAAQNTAFDPAPTA